MALARTGIKAAGSLGKLGARVFSTNKQQASEASRYIDTITGWAKVQGADKHLRTENKTIEPGASHLSCKILSNRANLNMFPTPTLNELAKNVMRVELKELAQNNKGSFDVTFNNGASTESKEWETFKSVDNSQELSYEELSLTLRYAKVADNSRIANTPKEEK